jgi:hypothetical protein
MFLSISFHPSVVPMPLLLAGQIHRLTAEIRQAM